ncbi:MAG: hypothetical protein FJY43_12265, partial [Betaproteobacteria bacterium]|nr:hypothetical protein [Betaproteobacteria bacterium]
MSTQPAAAASTPQAFPELPNTTEYHRIPPNTTEDMRGELDFTRPAQSDVYNANVARLFFHAHG